MFSNGAHIASPLFRFRPPMHGARNPGNTPGVTTPGSFALAPDVGGPLMFASPDTPGMPAPSDKTAWDFLPDGWRVERKWPSGQVAEWPNEDRGSDSTSPLRHSATSPLTHTEFTT
ncbi:MAG: hypothetical protein ACREJT_14550, partial [Myxococcota bacterium]